VREIHPSQSDAADRRTFDTPSISADIRYMRVLVDVAWRANQRVGNLLIDLGDEAAS
jgi:hypothetical protein